MPQAVLAALGLRERGLLERGRGRVTEPLDRLLGALAGRRLLLVTDNCEHLVEETARLADAILASCPAVHILATSREPLVVTGETLCPVPSLRLPPEDVAPADAAGYAAVCLFPDRGSATRPDLELTPDNVAAVVQVCRRLDGLPLAIEVSRRSPAFAVGRSGGRAPGRPLRPAHRRRSHGSAAPPDAARGGRLELGAAGRARAGAPAPSLRVRRQRHTRGG